jgi:hypothetical protein
MLFEGALSHLASLETPWLLAALCSILLRQPAATFLLLSQCCRFRVELCGRGAMPSSAVQPTGPHLVHLFQCHQHQHKAKCATATDAAIRSTWDESSSPECPNGPASWPALRHWHL